MLYKQMQSIHEEQLLSDRKRNEPPQSFEPPHNKTNKMTCAPSEDSDQPGYPPCLIRVFVVRSMGS